MMLHKYTKNKKDCKNLMNMCVNNNTNTPSTMIGGARFKQIYFIRHGETEWNKLGKSQGQEANTSLNDIGREQSIKTGEYLKTYRLKGKPFDCILCSPLKRASETAAIIADEINFDHDKITFMDELMELKMGQLSGTLRTDDLRQKEATLRNDALKKMIDPIKRYNIESYKNAEKFYDELMGDIGVERYDEVMPRIKFIVKYLRTTPCKKIIVITHSGLLGVLLRYIFKINVLPRGDFSNGNNCGICYCVCTRNGYFEMVSPPNTEHLAIV